MGGGIEMPDTDTTEAVEALVAGLGEVHGRKKLQKIAFLLQSFGVPLPQRFFFHFYGPYSDHLANDIQWLVDAGWLREEARQTAAGFSEYVYRVERGVSQVILDPEALRVAAR